MLKPLSIFFSIKLIPVIHFSLKITSGFSLELQKFTRSRMHDLPQKMPNNVRLRVSLTVSRVR